MSQLLKPIDTRVLDRGKDPKNHFHATCLLPQKTPLRILIFAAGKNFDLCAVRPGLPEGAKQPVHALRVRSSCHIGTIPSTL